MSSAPPVASAVAAARLARTVHRVDTLLDDRFRMVTHGGLTRRHWQLLTVLVDGVSDAETTTGVLRGYEPELADLVRRGWVVEDAGLRVTVEGSARYQEAIDEVVASREAAVDGIGADELAVAVDVLRRIAANLEK
ncbi:hypothetical protein [Luteimicrobium subarcticum]|uniref:hypothetical protein n=1 Tax=Luteimicrobium subarcticum TaxID=620910 RepID=UPI0012FE621F|nr:hypothetical protein [Luteimicrobium subarcticum]